MVVKFAIETAFPYEFAILPDVSFQLLPESTVKSMGSNILLDRDSVFEISCWIYVNFVAAINENHTSYR